MTPTLNIIINGIDPVANAFCAATGFSDKRVVHRFVRSLKADGLLDLCYAIYPFLGATSAAHAINLVNPALYPITWANSPTHSTGGVQFNGTTNYGQCVGLTGNTVVPHLSGQTIYLRTNSAQSSGATKRYCGFGDAGGARYYVLDYADNAGFEANRGCVGAVANYTAESTTTQRTGCLSVNRTSTTDMKAYNSGVQFLSNTASDTSTPDAFDCYIGGFNQGGVLNAPCAETFGLYAVHQGMTAAQALAFCTHITTLQTAVGRNV